MHVGDVILEFYNGEPPSWNTVGTVTQAELRRLVIERLKKKDCGDVADILEASPLDTAVAVFRKRFKTLQEKKRPEEERNRVAERQAVSEGGLQNPVVCRLVLVQLMVVTTDPPATKTESGSG